MRKETDCEIITSTYLRIHISLVSNQRCENTTGMRTLHDPLGDAFHGICTRRLPMFPQKMQRGISICSREMHDRALFQQQLHQLQIHSTACCHQWCHASISIRLEIQRIGTIGGLDKLHRNVNIQKRMRFEPCDHFTAT